MLRKIFHNGPAGYSFAFEFAPEEIRVATAFCNENDNFSRKLANTILNGRLDKGKYTERFGICEGSYEAAKVFNEAVKQTRAFVGKFNDSGHFVPDIEPREARKIVPKVLREVLKTA